MRVSENLLERFTKVARSLGLSRSGAIRMAMEIFIESHRGETMTSKMRGYVKSNLSIRDLEEAYMVSRL